MVKDKIIQALAYPRALVRANLELENCFHGGNYAAEDGTCQTCDYGPECQWLYSNDEFVALKQKSAEQLVDSLGFALECVNAQVTQWRHNQLTCQCEACAWLRSTQALYDDLAEAD